MLKTGAKSSTLIPRDRRATQTAAAAAGSSSGRREGNTMIYVISVILIIVLLMTFLSTWISWIMDRRRYKPDLQSAEKWIIDGGIAKPYYVDDEGKAYSTEMSPISSTHLDQNNQ
uniref:Uncharacterized protein n=1 Tax=Romanomermis culicivorax TaxID=13658 RepID=A0A915K8I8_ROMCU